MTDDDRVVLLWSCGCSAPADEDGQPAEHQPICLYPLEPKPKEDRADE